MLQENAWKAYSRGRVSATRWEVESRALSSDSNHDATNRFAGRMAVWRDASAEQTDQQTAWRDATPTPRPTWKPSTRVEHPATLAQRLRHWWLLWRARTLRCALHRCVAARNSCEEPRKRRANTGDGRTTKSDRQAAGATALPRRPHGCRQHTKLLAELAGAEEGVASLKHRQRQVAFGRLQRRLLYRNESTLLAGPHVDLGQSGRCPYLRARRWLLPARAANEGALQSPTRQHDAQKEPLHIWLCSSRLEVLQNCSLFVQTLET